MNGKRLLILGSGAREHALAWKLVQSSQVGEVICAPGNPGSAKVASNVPVRANDPEDVVRVCREQKVELLVVGPEAPLVAGVADAARRANVAVFGPDAAAARIEGSKAFAKEIMTAANVPTAECRVFDSPGEAQDYARQRGPIVIKADGLAAGKGVVVADGPDQAVEAIAELATLGEAGRRLVIEERLEGEEVSVIALCDGERYVLLSPAQDHKRVGDGDQGPNTGGMGAYTPTPFFGAAAVGRVGAEVIAPTLRELARRGCPFRGALYAGLMLTKSGPKVLEFNCRLGDPETQVLLLALNEDLFPTLWACATGRVETRHLATHPGVSVGVVLASRGYPASSHPGAAIHGLDDVPGGVEVFHAGTAARGSQTVTAGGRVLTVCARGDDLETARTRAYSAIEKIGFEGMHFRRDIGARSSTRA